MSRARYVAGLIAGILLLLSSAMHMLLGWKAMREMLLEADPRPELMVNMHLGWQLGGAAMIAFGVITVWTFARRLRGMEASLIPTGVIAATYVVFGVWALVASGGGLFFLLSFVVPGVLLGIGSVPSRD